MNREATIFYLREVVDLEVAKQRITALYNNEKRQCEIQINNLKKTIIPPRKPEDYTPSKPVMKSSFESSDSSSIAMSIMFALLGYGFCMWGIIKVAFCGYQLGFLLFCVPLGVFIALLGIGEELSIYLKYNKEYSDYLNASKPSAVRMVRLQNIHYNKTVIDPIIQKRDQAIKEVKAYWEQQEKYYNIEYRKVCDIVNSYYAMNIIPRQYRCTDNDLSHFSTLYYIYDWMSSTPDSLRDTLFHTHIEDGIRRIESSLAQISRQVERQIYETRCLRNDTRAVHGKVNALISKNNSMLRSLEQTAQNTAETAQYAELASNYSKANAYFSLANYFRS